MIKVLFPQGGYGTYLARCLYSYTTLNSGMTDTLIDFDLAGSSHSFRKNQDAKIKIWQGHPTSLDWTNNANDIIIVVLPRQEHHLDYYNNQFHKQDNQQLVKFILSLISIEEINNKLKTGWGYNKLFDASVPKWILREFFSMWITNCFANGYSITQYNIPSRLTIDTQDIILRFESTFDMICQQLSLTKIVKSELINQNHKTFLISQRYLNSQLNCEQWVDAVVEKKESLSPCQTIFDESYIQHILKIRGYEIKCDGLDNFPKSSLEMNSLIYENI
jgi:hypothetical protein